MATKKTTNYFTELDLVDVTRNIEKKGKFSYLSWAYAVRELKKGIQVLHGWYMNMERKDSHM